MKTAKQIAFLLIIIVLICLVFTLRAGASSQDNGLIGWMYENQNSDHQGNAVNPDINSDLSGFDEEDSVSSENSDFWLELDAMIQGVDLRPFDTTMKQAPDEVQELWGGRSAGEIIKEMASGKELVSMEETGSMVLNLFKRAFLEHVGFITALLALSIITGFLEQIKGAFGTNASDMAGFVCYSMAVILAAASFARLIASTRESLDILSGLMEMAFPPLLILLGASGAPASAGLLQPATTLLTATMNALNKNFFLPLFLAMGVLSIVENISKNVSLGRMQKLLQSVSKWSIGGISTLYLGVITLRGINAKAQDGLSLRAARYALDKFVPYVGTLLSGSTDAALGAAMILKNGLGICVLMALCGLLALPLLRIISTQLAFRVISAAVEALGDSRLAKATDSMANALSYLFAIVAVQALMFILTVALIMGAGVR